MKACLGLTLLPRLKRRRLRKVRFGDASLIAKTRFLKRATRLAVNGGEQSIEMVRLISLVKS